MELETVPALYCSMSVSFSSLDLSRATGSKMEKTVLAAQRQGTGTDLPRALILLSVLKEESGVETDAA